MGVYFRRRISFGPFALNFSTRGIGISTGVKGARLSTGPNATFIHLGRHGFYYKKKIGGFPKSKRKERDKVFLMENSNRIESSSIKNFQKSSSDAFLKELQEKVALSKYSNTSLIFSGVLFLFSLKEWAPSELKWLILVMGVLAYSLLFKKDVQRKTMKVLYELDGSVRKSFEKLNEGFESLSDSENIWRIELQQKTHDWKRNSGASMLIVRKPFEVFKELPPLFDSNIIPYGFKCDGKHYYFFPNKILIYEGSEIGAVDYSELHLTSTVVEFIEKERVPNDTEVVGYNWKYMNKKGGPDGRFVNNYQIPRVLYSDIAFMTDSGINLKFYVSNKYAGARFVNSFRAMMKLKPKKWKKSRKG